MMYPSWQYTVLDESLELRFRMMHCATNVVLLLTKVQYGTVILLLRRKQHLILMCGAQQGVIVTIPLLTKVNSARGSTVPLLTKDDGGRADLDSLTGTSVT